MDSKSSNMNKTIESGSKKLYVKFMVSLRCKIITKSELEKLGLPYKFSTHGALEFKEGISKEQYDQLKKNLLKFHMILLSENESNLIDNIINTIVEVIHYSNTLPKVNFIELIDKKTIVGEDPILKIFSDVKGMSVIQFIIIQKIERAKEMLIYEDTSLSDIADLLNYESKRLLVAQFKKVTGLTPEYFLTLKKERAAIALNATS